MHRAPQELRTYFLTFVTAQRRRLFQVEANSELFLQVLHTQREKGRFHLYSFVIMADHIHLLLTPGPDVSLEKAVQFLKGGFSFLLKSKLDVWERGYNESRIADAGAFEACKRYIEQNPVRKGLAADAADYAYSSASLPTIVQPAPPWLRRKALG